MSPLLSQARHPARLGIRGIDWILRRAYGVVPFSYEPGCIIRIGFGGSPRSIVLSDGVQVDEGASVVELHLWNERLLDLPPGNDSLGWGRLLVGHAVFSLHLLAEYVEHEAAAAECTALHAEFGFVTDLRSAKVVLERLGFDVGLKEAPAFRFWRRAFWDNFWSFLLLWTFGPHSMPGKELGRLQRVEIWMSRARLAERYRDGGESASSSLHRRTDVS